MTPSRASAAVTLAIFSRLRRLASPARGGERLDAELEPRLVGRVSARPVALTVSKVSSRSTPRGSGAAGWQAASSGSSEQQGKR